MDGGHALSGPAATTFHSYNKTNPWYAREDASTGLPLVQSNLSLRVQQSLYTNVKGIATGQCGLRVLLWVVWVVRPQFPAAIYTHVSSPTT